MEKFNKKKSSDRDYLNVYNNLNNFKKTLITYDYGNTWRPIKAPEKNVNGEAI